MADPARQPVIVGVGQVNDRTVDPDEALDACGLMIAALREADRDGRGGWLDRLDTLDMVRLFSASMEGVPERLADAMPGLRTTPCFRPGHGTTPMIILASAARRIAEGEAEICAVTGAEAYLTEKRLATRAAGAAGRPDMMMKQLRGSADPINLRYGAVTPIEIYPLFENGMRAYWGQSLSEGQAESAEIWSSFSKVAAANPHAWIRREYAPGEILEVRDGNRKLSFPYTTLTVANNSVNQGAAVILTSLARARALGYPEDELVFVGASACASEPANFRDRRDYHSSPSLAESIRGALERQGISAEACDHLELYSCFPCVPKLARRVAPFRHDIPLTVSGGLTFAGGPIRNYMMHATAQMVGRLRNGGENGLLLGNGGYLTEAFATVLSRKPPEGNLGGLDPDVQARSDASRGEVPVFADAYVGPGTIETYTVSHDRQGLPVRGVILGRTPRGERFICGADAADASMMDFLMSGVGEPVGTAGRVIVQGDGSRIWAVA